MLLLDFYSRLRMHRIFVCFSFVNVSFDVFENFDRFVARQQRYSWKPRYNPKHDVWFKQFTQHHSQFDNLVLHCACRYPVAGANFVIRRRRVNESFIHTSTDELKPMEPETQQLSVGRRYYTAYLLHNFALFFPWAVYHIDNHIGLDFNQFVNGVMILDRKSVV